MKKFLVVTAIAMLLPALGAADYTPPQLDTSSQGGDGDVKTVATGHGDEVHASINLDSRNARQAATEQLADTATGHSDDVLKVAVGEDFYEDLDRRGIVVTDDNGAGDRAALFLPDGTPVRADNGRKTVRPEDGNTPEQHR